MIKLDNKQELLNKMQFAINNYKWAYIHVYITGVNPEPEAIGNPLVNFESKIKYYDQAYNEDLTLKANPDIKINAYTMKGGK